jgi:hypothetical protein
VLARCCLFACLRLPWLLCWVRVGLGSGARRLDEKATKAEIATLFQFGAQWEKVGKLINIAPKANEKRTVDRMRKLLLTLKNDDGKKPGASAGADSKASK